MSIRAVKSVLASICALTILASNIPMISAEEQDDTVKNGVVITTQFKDPVSTDAAFTYRIESDPANDAGDPVPVGYTVTGGEEPVSAFDGLEFEQAGVYKYTVTELCPESGTPGIVYDDEHYELTVTVNDDLSVSYSTKEITFTGKTDDVVYAAPYAGTDGPGEEFELVADADNDLNALKQDVPALGSYDPVPMPADKLIMSDNAGVVYFGGIAYTREGVYRYTIKRLLTGEKVEVIVTVVREDDSLLHASVAYAVDGTEHDGPVFFEPVPEPEPENMPVPSPSEDEDSISTPAPTETGFEAESPEPSATAEVTGNDGAVAEPEITDMPDTTPVAGEGNEDIYTPEPVAKDSEPDNYDKADKDNDSESEQLPTIEELKNESPDTAGATIEHTGIRLMSLVFGKSWSFDVYYVGEKDSNHVDKTNDFNLKYQMEFHTDEDIPENAIKITIPASLINDRNGAPIYPKDFGIPQGTPEKFTKTKYSSFNYYYDEAKKNLIFFNYELIEAGENEAWQVLYKNVNVMNIVDESAWELQSNITVTIPDTSEPETAGEPSVESKTVEALTGTVDTTAKLESVSKIAATTGQAYGPGLYTEKQVGSYISGALPSWCSGSSFSDYKYVLWKVTARGTGTQPFNLGFVETPSINGDTSIGKIVGYSGISVQGKGSTANGLTGYDVLATNSMQKSWTEQFYVVIAYSAGDGQNQAHVGSMLENAVEMKLVPVDGKDEETVKSAAAKWSYVDYKWTYGGNIAVVTKSSDGTYPGWLKVYKTASEHGDSTPYCTFAFNTSGSVRAYDKTHITSMSTNGPVLGSAILGKSYKVTTVDDAVYAYPGGQTVDGGSNGEMLGREDYYFTNVSVSQKDVGFDVWEDTTTTPEKPNRSGMNQGIDVYAMFAKNSDGSDNSTETWEKVTTVEWSDTGTMNYTFTADDLKREPYRVKVEHETINYSTSCNIGVTLLIRHDSPKMRKYFENDADIASVQFENVSGMSCEVLTNGASASGGAEWIHSSNVNGITYPEPGLSDWTKAQYGVLMIRDSAMKTVTSLQTKSGASKSVSSTANDVVNGRLNVTYSLTAYDGYLIYADGPARYLRDTVDGLRSPGRNEVVFYDLLPYGMQFDPSYKVTAGRLTSLSSNAFDSSQVTVYVDEKTDVIQNWNNTERTRIAFHIKYSGDDSTAFSNSGENAMWYSGWGVSFRAYYDWQDLSLSDESSNISAFMPERDDNESFLGEAAQDNGRGISGTFSQAATLFGEDIDRDGNTDEKTVLYASASVNDDVVLASRSNVKKLVRADNDKYGIFRQSATVAPGAGYTYELTVSNAGHYPLENIVIYDRLEYACEDRDVDLYGELTFDDKSWYGTFAGLDIEALTLLGISPTVYYNGKRDATVTTGQGVGSSDYTEPDDVLTAANGWYTSDEWVKTHDLSDVKAVAVKLNGYSLNNMQSVSFKIHMTAPTDKQSATYAYNNPMFYSTSTDTVTSGTVIGDSVRVGLATNQALVIEKEFSETTPSSIMNMFASKAFLFTLYEQDGKEEVPFADRTYTLWTKDGNDEWVQENPNTLLATDANGQLSLKAGQKAIFKDVPDPQRIMISEEESPFWLVSRAVTDTEQDGVNYHNVLIENEYRPVLYAKKTLKAVPDTEKGAQARKDGFTFRLTVNGEPAKDTEFWYVNSARTDGGIPTKVTSKGESGIGHTDDSGQFTIYESDIIALIGMGRAGDRYELTEVDTGDNWVCEQDTMSGTLSVMGSQATITNVYKWKDLLLTKAITHQDVSEAKGELFTFTLEHDTGSGYAPVTTHNEWVVLDSKGNEMTESAWSGDGRTGAFKGVLGDNGEFTCDCAGLTIKIKDLEAQTDYRVTETEHGEFYRPTGDVNVTMPLYALSIDETITNDWQKRPLSITKTVDYDRRGDGAKEIEDLLKSQSFRMLVEIETDGVYRPLSSFPYTLTNENGTSAGSGTTDSNGYVTLMSGQTAYFKDAGVLGSKFRITEEPVAKFPQISPTDNAAYEDSLNKDENQATIINGAPGSLTLRKEYTYDSDDKDAKAFADKVSELLMKGSEQWSEDEAALMDRARVTFTLTATGSSGDRYKWPNTDTTVKKVGVDGTLTDVVWTAHQGIDLYPGESIVLAAGSVGSGMYTVQETSENKHWLYQWENDPDETWIQCEQAYPENDRSFSSTTSQAPEAVIRNRLTGVPVTGSTIGKRMILGADEVPNYASLVWVVERFDGTAWKPAENVPYIMFNGTDGVLDCDAVQYTDEDGRMELYMTENGLPWVEFTNDDVKIENVKAPKSGDMRIRELLNESDAEWGVLAGYSNWDDAETEFTLDYTDVNEMRGAYFVNTNRTTPVEIEKAMDEASDTAFTMTLEQVTETLGSDPITRENYTTHITDTAIRPGTPYTVYRAADDTVVGSYVVNDNGGIELKAGQYARLDLPDKTLWTVSEESTPGFALEGLDPEVGNDRLTRLDDNLMLINQAAPVIAVRLEATLKDETKTFSPGDEFSKDMFNVTVTYSNGETRTLTDADDWYFGESAIPDDWDAETFDVEIWYEGLSDTVTVGVILEPYTVKYAVRIYGIKQDTTENGNLAGLTFGPAGGYGNEFIYTSGGAKYRSCDNPNGCLHDLSWEEIAEKAKTNPEAFEQCMQNRCTKAVPFNITGPIAGSNYNGEMNDCDGASILYHSIANNYKKWNDSNVTAGGWKDSKIRNTLTGATNEAIVSHGGTLTEEQSLYAMLPQVLKDNIVSKKVISATTSTRSGDNLVTTYDKLWLFSSYEMYKSGGERYNSTYIDEREGQLYQSQEYLDAKGTSSASASTNPVNRFYNERGVADWAWSRSLYSSRYVVIFYNYGYPYYIDASYAGYGLAPGFCLGECQGPYTVKYAVRIYGIKQDVDEDENPIGLTFGPAGGSDDGTHSYCYAGIHTYSRSHCGRNDKYKSCDNPNGCLHDLSWEEIVKKAKTNPEAFEQCLQNRCTKAVPFNITGVLAGTTYAGQMDDCDGASCLRKSISTKGWNNTYTTTGGWRDSKIRNTLTGATNDAIVSHGGTLTEDQSLYAMLPDVLKDNIVPKKVISATSEDETSELAETYDKLWLYSTKEMYNYTGGGTVSLYNDREGQLYQSQDYLGANKENKFYDEEGYCDYGSPWSRTVGNSRLGSVVYFHYDGKLGSGDANGDIVSLAPGFCIGKME